MAKKDAWHEEKNPVMRKVLALIYLSPAGRLVLYLLALGLIILVTLLASQNDFDIFYLSFGAVSLVLIVVYWLREAVKLARKSERPRDDESDAE